MLFGTTRAAVKASIGRLIALIVLPLTVLLCLGCATTDDGFDQPWNTPESWEAHPGIPGLSDF